MSSFYLTELELQQDTAKKDFMAVRVSTWLQQEHFPPCSAAVCQEPGLGGGWEHWGAVLLLTPWAQSNYNTFPWINHPTGMDFLFKTAPAVVVSKEIDCPDRQETPQILLCATQA